MRGTVEPDNRKIGIYGITPAHAGNRQQYFVNWRSSGDHPRSCGEQYQWGLRSHPGRGSPPLMRGTVGCAVNRAGPQRITPAHAGNSKVDGVNVNLT